LASSWISKEPAGTLAWTPAIQPQELESLRCRGWRGGWIAPHRAFVRLRIRPWNVASGLLLAISFCAAWLLLLASAGRLWAAIFSFWARQMGLPSGVVMVPQHWAGIRFALPYLNLRAGAADPVTWWVVAVVTLAAAAGSFFISHEALPWTYLLRFLAIIQGVTVMYFAFAAASFPHDLSGYTVSMLMFSAVLIGLVPVIFGFTFYIFDFSFLQKLALTLMTMVHLALFVPLQYALHVYLLHQSILYMTVLYFAFGPFLDVLVFISFYSWGMSWKSSRLPAA
jgi:hypothetical protein